uniref:ShKT domain-containing protein n=1 Tax=Syphacia muris TaxID=451379 RepID=A0A0N5ALV6_9BILA
MRFVVCAVILTTFVNCYDDRTNLRYRTFRFEYTPSTQSPEQPTEKAKTLPCCRVRFRLIINFLKDTNSGTACRLMYSQSELDFKTRCNTEPDFSLVGCCKTCNLLGESFRERAKNFFSGKNASTHCFDRMSPEFCSRFDGRKDVWSSKKWSCDTSQSLIAFRVCRATCGFCDLDWENAPESRNLQMLLNSRFGGHLNDDDDDDDTINTTALCFLLKLSANTSIIKGNGRTSSPPCCRDMLGPTTCQRLLRNNEHYFADRCNKDAEFRLIQCCTTCGKCGKAMAYDLVARSLVSEQCFDRYGKKFCERYVNSTDVWSPMYWSCEGYNPHIAFRSCRESCGFCDFKVVHYTIDNALKACRTDRDQTLFRYRKNLSQSYYHRSKLH